VETLAADQLLTRPSLHRLSTVHLKISAKKFFIASHERLSAFSL
jgi:hypothetical protein